MNMALTLDQPIGDILGLIGLRDEGFPELFQELYTATEKLMEAKDEERHNLDQLTESERRAMSMARTLSKGRS